MALIKCRECGRDVSDKARVCPHCGCPMSIEENANLVHQGQNVTVEQPAGYYGDGRSDSSRKWLIGLIALLAVSVVGLGTYLLMSVGSGESTSQEAETKQGSNGAIPEGKYYIVLYKDNTGGLFNPDGGRICGLRAPNGRTEPLKFDLKSRIGILGKNSDRLYASADRFFADYNDYLRYYSDYNADKTLGISSERIESGDSLIIAFELQEEQIDKFNVKPIKISPSKGNYTLVYYSDETGDLFDDDGTHICGVRDRIGNGDYSLGLSKSISLYGKTTEDIFVDKGKVYTKYSDLLDDRLSYKATASKAKAIADIKEFDNAIVMTFSKTASYQGMVSTVDDHEKKERSTSESDEGEYIAGVLKKGNWAYSKSSDPMTDEATNSALCMSNESLKIGNYRTYLQLYLMHMSSGRNGVFVQVQDAVLRQDKLPMIYFRFDGGNIKTYAVLANGEHAHLIPNEGKANEIINSLKHSKKCAIKVETQYDGTVTFTFNTAGLEWNY